MLNQLKTIDRRLFTILLIVFVQMAGASMVLPILPLFVQRQFNLSPAVITLLNTSFFAAQFLAGPTIGRLSDKYGRLPVLIVSQIGTVISFIMLGLAQNVPTLFAARILDGITGGNIIVAQAYVTDITPREKRTQSLGYIFAVFGLGFIIGPSTGGILSAYLGNQLPFLIAAVAATITVLLTWFTLDETLTPEQRMANRGGAQQASLEPQDVARNTPLVLILFVVLGAQISFSMLQSTFPLYSAAVLFVGYDEQTTSVGVGLLLGLVGLGQLSTQLFLIRRMVARYGEASLVVIGILIRAVAMLIFALVTSPWLAAGGTIALSVGAGLMMPSMQALATTTVDDKLRGGVLGWYQSANSLAIILGSAVSGVLFAVYPTVPYWVGAILFTVMTLPALLLLRWSRAGRLQPVAIAAD